MNYFKKIFLKKKSFLITLCTCGLCGYQKNIKIIIILLLKLFFIVINVSNNVINKFIIIILENCISVIYTQSTLFIFEEPYNLMILFIFFYIENYGVLLI